MSWNELVNRGMPQTLARQHRRLEAGAARATAAGKAQHILSRRNWPGRAQGWRAPADMDAALGGRVSVLEADAERLLAGRSQLAKALEAAIVASARLRLFEKAAALEAEASGIFEQLCLTLPLPTSQVVQFYGRTGRIAHPGEVVGQTQQRLERGEKAAMSKAMRAMATASPDYHTYLNSLPDGGANALVAVGQQHAHSRMLHTGNPILSLLAADRTAGRQACGGRGRNHDPGAKAAMARQRAARAKLGKAIEVHQHVCAALTASLVANPNPHIPTHYE